MESARFRHVLLYGPPAAGKLTVGRELAGRTGFALLDNHVTIDVARTLFDFGASGFWPLVNGLRLQLLEAAAEQGVDVITTFVYGPKDRPFVTKLEAIVDEGQGATCAVQLRPSIEELQRRVTLPSRVEGRKLSDPDRLLRSIDRFKLFEPIDPTDLSIDNTALPAAIVAEQIDEHSRLRGGRASR